MGTSDAVGLISVLFFEHLTPPPPSNTTHSELVTIPFQYSVHKKPVCQVMKQLFLLVSNTSSSSFPLFILLQEP